jgi:hypothetical protein
MLAVAVVGLVSAQVFGFAGLKMRRYEQLVAVIMALLVLVAFVALRQAVLL